MNSQRIVPVVALAAAVLLVGATAQAAPTPISSLPYTISQSGAYQMTKDLTYAGAGDAILVTASSVTLDGASHTLTGPGGGTGIHVKGASQVSITSARVTGFSMGIWLENASHSTLTTNNATGNTDGIVLDFGSLNTLTGNTVSGNNSGLRASTTSFNTLSSNTVSYSSAGGILMNNASNGNTLHGNTANNNGVFGINLSGNSNNLDGNTANSNRQIGINLFSGSSNTVHGNTASFNLVTGIFLGSVSASAVRDNTASHNRLGIDVDAASVGNTLVHNTAQGNIAYDLEDDGLPPCQNGWANNLYVTDNETGIAAGPTYGCIR